jgi:hypothetical protein
METYIICSGGTTTTTNVTAAYTSVAQTRNWTAGCDFIETTRDLTFTADKASTANYLIAFSFDEVGHTNNDPLYVANGQIAQMYMMAGQTTMTYTVSLYYHRNCGGGQYVYSYNQTNFQLAPQQMLPTCVTPPIACTLKLSGMTKTDTSIKGANDGSIFIGVTGATGATITWKLNGVVQTGTALTHTFSGLASGFYQIEAIEGGCFDFINQIQIFDGEFRTGAFTVVSPPSIVATENPIIVSLSTAVNSYQPVPSMSTIIVTSGITNNDSITIKLAYPQDYTAVFTAKEFPNRDDYFLTSVLKDSFGVSVGTNSLAEIAESIQEVLSKDIILSRLYYFRASGTSVYCLAKENNVKLNLNSSSVTLVGNLQIVMTQAGISAYDGQLTQNYSLYTDILINTSAQYGETLTIDKFNKVSQLELPFQISNQHLFDLSAVLKNFVSTDKLDFSVTGYTTLANMMTAYMVQYGEKYPLVPNSTTKKSRVKGTIPQNFCINSALDWTENNNLLYMLGSGITSGSTTLVNMKFLTNQPNPKQVQRDSSEFLYVILPKDYGKPLKVKGDLYFYDGSILSGETLYTITTGTTNYGGVFALAAGYNELNLKSYEVLTGGSTRKIRRVDFAIWQTSGATEIPLTETLSYRYEIDEQPRRYGVAFLNKWGVWSIFDFSGEIVNGVIQTNQAMEVPREIGLLGASPKGFQANTIFDTKATDTIDVNSGWIDEKHFDWLIELLASNRIYNYTDDNQPFLIVKSVNYKKSSNDDLFTVDVSFSETLQVNNVSI